MNSRRRASKPRSGPAPPVDASRCAKASRLFAADRFADLMDHDERRTGRIAQVQRTLAQRRHRARVVSILVVSGVQRVEHDHLSGGLPDGVKEVIQSLRRAEEIAAGSGPPKGFWSAAAPTDRRCPECAEKYSQTYQR